VAAQTSSSVVFEEFRDTLDPREHRKNPHKGKMAGLAPQPRDGMPDRTPSAVKEGEGASPARRLFNNTGEVQARGLAKHFRESSHAIAVAEARNQAGRDQPANAGRGDD